MFYTYENQNYTKESLTMLSDRIALPIRVGYTFAPVNLYERVLDNTFETIRYANASLPIPKKVDSIQKRA